MSNTNSQKVRRNATSPSTRQGPLRATQQFALVGGSPSRKHVVRQTHTSSPTSKPCRNTKARSHSETGFVSDRRSPTSLNYKVEKPKALRAAESLDNISLYLSGQWPKDGCAKQKSQQESGTTVSGATVSGAVTAACSSLTHQVLHSSALPLSSTYCNDGAEVFNKDEHTQTPDDWEDSDSKKQLTTHRGFVPYKRSKSVGSNENWLKSRDIKARLQRKDNAVRSSQSTQRFSPVPVLSTALSPRATQPIKIPVPIHENGVLRGTPGKARASVEGLNPEIEKLIISATSTITSTEDDCRYGLPVHFFDHPDGHRAPVPESLNNLRDVDTQTPSQSELFMGGESLPEQSVGDYYIGCRSVSRASTDTESASSRPQSISPSPFLLGPLDIDEPNLDCGDAFRQASSTTTSPRPNSANFVRLPPDGAEKLKVVNEIATVPHMKTFLTPALMSTIKLQPSERSAFSSLVDRRAAVAVTAMNTLSTATVVPIPAIPSRSPIPIRFVEESH